MAVTAEFLVDSINGLTEQHPEISVEWVGLILVSPGRPALALLLDI